MPEIPIETVFPKGDPEFDLEVDVQELREAIETCCPDHKRDLERLEKLARLARLGAAVEAAKDGTKTVTAGPVAIACMKPESRDLLDHMISEYAKFKQVDSESFCGDSGVYGFAYWLCRYSRIVAPVNQNDE